MKTRLVRSEDLAQLLRRMSPDELMRQMIDRLERACRDFDESTTHVRVRDGFHYFEPQVGLVEWMPVMRTGQAVTIKTVGYHPANPAAQSVPSVISTVGTWDTQTGHLLGLADGVFLTALRTGAASAVASRRLARPGSRHLGLIGAGAQAVTQLHALLCCFPIQRVLIHDVDPGALDSFRNRVASFAPDSLDIRPAPVEILVQSSDILCTATSVDVGAGPLFQDMPTRDWLHINAVGADFAGKVELPLALLERAFVCPDFGEQTAIEGECQQLEPEQVGPDLVHLLQAPEDPALRDRLTVFDSTGYALEDEVAMNLLLELCDHYGLGTELELEATGGDPLNPYDLGGCSLAGVADARTRKA